MILLDMHESDSKLANPTRLSRFDDSQRFTLDQLFLILLCAFRLSSSREVEIGVFVVPWLSFSSC